MTALGFQFTRDLAKRMIAVTEYVEGLQRSEGVPPDRAFLPRNEFVDSVVVRQRDPMSMGRTIQVSQVRQTRNREFLFVPGITVMFCWGNSRVRHFASLAQPSGDVVTPGTNILIALNGPLGWEVVPHHCFPTPYIDERFFYNDCAPRTV